MSMTAVMRDRLEDVFRRAGIPEETVKYFEGAYIEKVKVSRRNRSWTFYLVLGRPVPPDPVFRSGPDQRGFPFSGRDPVFDPVRPCEPFSADGDVLAVDPQAGGGSTFPSAAGWLARAEWQLEGERLTLVFANPMMNQMAVAKQLDQVVASLFQEISGTRIQVALTFRESDEARENSRRTGRDGTAAGGGSDDPPKNRFRRRRGRRRKDPWPSVTIFTMSRS